MDSEPSKSFDYNVTVTEEKVFFDALIPYVTRKDIRVDLSPHRIVVSATKRNLSGRPESVTTRTVDLAWKIDPESAVARFDDRTMALVVEVNRVREAVLLPSGVQIGCGAEEWQGQGECSA